MYDFDHPGGSFSRLLLPLAFAAPDAASALLLLLSILALLLSPPRRLLLPEPVLFVAADVPLSGDGATLVLVNLLGMPSLDDGVLPLATNKWAADFGESAFDGSVAAPSKTAPLPASATA